MSNAKSEFTQLLPMVNAVACMRPNTEYSKDSQGPFVSGSEDVFSKFFKEAGKRQDAGIFVQLSLDAKKMITDDVHFASTAPHVKVASALGTVAKLEKPVLSGGKPLPRKPSGFTPG